MSRTQELSPRLFTLFFDCYNTFKDRFHDEDCSEGAIICFGVSGAGKSTFLARLRSRAEPEEFCASLPTEEGTRVEIEDIEIGKGVGSCTLVPVMYKVGHLRMFDVPGFKDTDTHKEIVINILHKCLLTKIREARFVVIVSIKHVMSEDNADDKLGHIINDYHNKLKDLFGRDNYETFLDNIHFVLTNNDGGRFTEEDISSRLTTAVMGVVGRVNNDFAAKFLMRMKTHHITVDYLRDTQEALLEQLHEAMSAGKSLGVRIPEIQDHSLTTNANKLDDFCTRTIDYKLDAFDTFSARVVGEFSLNKDKVESFREDLWSVETKIAQYKANIKELENRIVRATQSVEDNRQLCEEASAKIMQTKEDIARLEQDHKFHCDTLGLFQSVSMRGDMARDIGVLSTHFEFQSSIVMDHKEAAQMNCLVVGDEPGDETLRRYIDNNGTLIPQDISQIERCKLDIVKFNSRSNHKVPSFFKIQTVEYNETQKLLKVRFTSARKFKVLIYTSVPFATTAAAEAMTVHYCRGLDQASVELNKWTLTREQAEAVIETAHQTVHTSQGQLAEQRSHLESASRDKQSKENDYQAGITAAETFIKEQKVHLDALSIAPNEVMDNKFDKDATRIKKIAMILIENNLHSDLIRKIQKHETATRNVRDKLAEMDREIHVLARPKEMDVAGSTTAAMNPLGSKTRPEAVRHEEDIVSDFEMVDGSALSESAAVIAEFEMQLLKKSASKQKGRKKKGQTAYERRRVNGLPSAPREQFMFHK